MMQTNINRRTERKGQSNGRHQINGCGKRQRRGTEPVRSAHKWVDSPRYTYSPLSCRSPQRKSVIQAHETQDRLVYYCPVWPVHVTEQICKTAKQTSLIFFIDFGVYIKYLSISQFHQLSTSLSGYILFFSHFFAGRHVIFTDPPFLWSSVGKITLIIFLL